jgi:hypothetical protein
MGVSESDDLGRLRPNKDEKLLNETVRMKVNFASITADVNETFYGSRLT